MRVTKLDNNVVVAWQGNAYWFDTMDEAEAFMKKIEDELLYQ